MSEDGKDAGLVAMISGILGGGKRASAAAAAPPPLAEAPPTIPAIEPANGVSADKPAADAKPSANMPSADKPASDKISPSENPKRADAAAPKDDELSPLDRAPVGPNGKRRLPANAIASLVHGELQKIDGFPATGTSITVYGYQHWNAMITFAPFSTTFEQAKRFRQALPDLVFKLRQRVELEI